MCALPGTQELHMRACLHGKQVHMPDLCVHCVALQGAHVKKPYNPVLGEVFKCYYELPEVMQVDREMDQTRTVRASHDRHSTLECTFDSTPDCSVMVHYTHSYCVGLGGVWPYPVGFLLQCVLHCRAGLSPPARCSTQPTHTHCPTWYCLTPYVRMYVLTPGYSECFLR